VAKGHIVPSGGLRQGNPISPHLFLFVSKGLSGLLRHCAQRLAIRGYRICQNAPIISHLLFADETIIFCDAEED